VQITYPVVLDLEQNQATARVSKSKLTAAGIAFMDIVKKAG
jgi:GH25 family lysozyme M1 (1,4-beta-N-acetylmuramidase)